MRCSSRRRSSTPSPPPCLPPRGPRSGAARSLPAAAAAGPARLPTTHRGPPPRRPGPHLPAPAGTQPAARGTSAADATRSPSSRSPGGCRHPRSRCRAAVATRRTSSPATPARGPAPADTHPRSGTPLGRAKRSATRRSHRTLRCPCWTLVPSGRLDAVGGTLVMILHSADAPSHSRGSASAGIRSRRGSSPPGRGPPPGPSSRSRIRLFLTACACPSRWGLRRHRGIRCRTSLSKPMGEGSCRGQ